MKSLDTSLGSFEISSISLGYRALDMISRASELRILEASPVGGGRFLILCSGEAQSLRHVAEVLRSGFGNAASESFVDFAIVEKKGAVLAESLFSLSQVQLGESLIVVECKTLSGLLASAETLLAFEGMEPIELKIHRGSATGGYGFFSGPTRVVMPAAEEVRTRLRAGMREGDVQAIENPVASFRRFFNFSGEA